MLGSLALVGGSMNGAVDSIGDKLAGISINIGNQGNGLGNGNGQGDETGSANSQGCSNEGDSVDCGNSGGGNENSP